jgi:4-amino-4-deoxy-L-arabinose transferase-like glycosyltransferase
MALAGSLTAVLLAWTMVIAGGDRRRWLGVAAVGASLAALAKGPVGIALPGLVAVAYAAWERDRSVLRRLGVVPVLGVATLAAAVWYLCAFVEQGSGFIDVVFKENVVRFIDTDDAKAGHAHGFFYLPVVGLVGALPWVPLLPLVVPRRGAPPPVRFAALWALVVVGFFSIANAKRSVYLLPAFPAIAICIGAAVAEGVSPLVRRLAIAYAPALVLLGATALALAAGLDPGTLFRHRLKPDDAHGATAVATAASRHAGAFVSLGVAMLGGAFIVEHARRAGDFARVATVVGALMVAGTAAFNGVIHPAVSHTRSLADFMATVDRMVPPDAVLATPFPTDPGLRFYAPRELVPFQPKAADDMRRVLLWQDEWSRLRDARGDALPVLAVSDARQSRRGSLALVLAPPGELRRVSSEASSPPPLPGIRAVPGR